MLMQRRDQLELHKVPICFLIDGPISLSLGAHVEHRFHPPLNNRDKTSVAFYTDYGICKETPGGGHINVVLSSLPRSGGNNKSINELAGSGAGLSMQSMPAGAR